MAQISKELQRDASTLFQKVSDLFEEADKVREKHQHELRDLCFEDEEDNMTSLHLRLVLANIYDFGVWKKIACTPYSGYKSTYK